MLRTTLKLFFRHARRAKSQSLLNIGGLAVGLASCILILLFVQNERSYDRFHANADQIYRITYDENRNGTQRYLGTVSPPVAPALVAEYPEVTHAVRLRDTGRTLFSNDDRSFYENAFFYADSSFFSVFSFPLQRGNPATALTASHTVVITPAIANKYFGEQDPIGQTLRMAETVDLTVTGILEPPSPNTHMPFDFLISFSTFRVPMGYPVTLESWGWISFPTYIRVAPGTDAEALENKLVDFAAAHFAPERTPHMKLRLQPVSDIYLDGPATDDMRSGNAAYVYSLTGIAVLLLLLVSFNFMSLSTVQAVQRTKETSIRKVLGANQQHLHVQYVSESVVKALFSLLLAVGLVELGRMGLAQGLGWSFSLSTSEYVNILVVSGGASLLIGLIGGIYPALLLTALRPADVMKGEWQTGNKGVHFRRVLVTLQFTIAIALIASTFIVVRQMQFVQDKNLGFAEEGVIALHAPGVELLTRYDALRDQLLQNSHVLNVAKGSGLFDGDQGSVPIYAEGAGDEPVRPMNLFSLHHGFVETLGLNIINGRAPNRSIITDSADAVVINQAALSALASHIPDWENPIGKQIRIGDIMEGHVIGVVEDFHFASLHAEIAPLVLFFPRTAIDKVFVRVQPGNAASILAALEQDWQQIFPDHPFTFTFLDEHLQQMYAADQRFLGLIVGFSLLTVLVACLGLYALVAFVTQLRVREIGIRKVLGASPSGVVVLLLKPFLLAIAAANVIAWPLGYIGMQRWLEAFAYRIEPSVFIFVLAGALTLLLALLTISHLSYKAARLNPVESLRRS